MDAVATAPQTIKVKVLTKLRGENLALPHIPWPEVHPDPIAVPKPTKNPAPIIREGVAEAGMASNARATLFCR
jgi:hypothetical protein